MTPSFPKHLFHPWAETKQNIRFLALLYNYQPAKAWLRDALYGNMVASVHKKQRCGARELSLDLLCLMNQNRGNDGRGDRGKE